jgi:hypothetical protein
MQIPMARDFWIACIWRDLEGDGRGLILCTFLPYLAGPEKTMEVSASIEC